MYSFLYTIIWSMKRAFKCIPTCQKLPIELSVVAQEGGKNVKKL